MGVISKFTLAAIATTAAALALTGAALAGGQSSYMDPTGEVPGSADVSGVSVSSDGSSFTFQVQTNWPAWDPNTFFAILVDSDQNAATGTAGFDYVVTGDRWGGTIVNTVHPLVVQTQSSLSNGLWTVTVPASAIGNPQAISFFVLTQVGPDQANPIEDRAPNSGTWSFPPAAPAPPPPPPVPTVVSYNATYAAAPVHGKAFRVTGLSLSLSNGSFAHAKALTCRATLAGRQFLGGGLSGCAFRLPKSAKGKRFVVTVTGSYASASLTKSYAFRVR